MNRSALLKLSRCRAALDGRDYVTPDEIQLMALPVLRHRLRLTPEAEIEDRPHQAGEPRRARREAREERDALAATRADWVVTSLRLAVEHVVNAANEAASADLEDQTRAPTVTPPAVPFGHSVVEFPVIFDQTQGLGSVHEETDAGASRAGDVR